ncbi:MAG: 16S rRNA (cytidine(1402)-2'-O)-methyltransferase [Oscillospiraceae bacterium]|nr:16S rRNA (cytidine(1402)-2'-O)-methyltransferase [Oscillospiraceae bacterium]
MSGKLYVVGTPIGNLEDMTYRAVRILSEVDFICAEDTRVTLKLLNHFDIKKPLVSCHEHSHGDVFTKAADRIAAGESCAVVTDAGMPCISDPGAVLIGICYERGIPVESVPGPTAVATAAALCGLDATRFAFEGFLSVAKKQRYAHLTALARDPHTLIFYEAPHKLKQTLADMLAIFGDRRISLCHELTKIHESVQRTTLSQAAAYYENVTPKGEYVLVVEGFVPDDDSAEYTIEDAVAYAKQLAENGMRPTDSAKEAARLTGFKKSEIYSLMK